MPFSRGLVCFHSAHPPWGRGASYSGAERSWFRRPFLQLFLNCCGKNRDSVEKWVEGSKRNSHERRPLLVLQLPGYFLNGQNWFHFEVELDYSHYRVVLWVPVGPSDPKYHIPPPQPLMETHRCISVLGPKFSLIFRCRWIARCGMRRMGRSMCTSLCSSRPEVGHCGQLARSELGTSQIQLTKSLTKPRITMSPLPHEDSSLVY